MKQKCFLWLEDYLFIPNTFQKIISFLLLPFTALYLFIILIKRLSSKEIDYHIPIISIGNIIIGGSGKTPLVIHLAKNFKNVCVILRGYKRRSKGLVLISNKGKILQNVQVAGDEALLLASALNSATIIVSENRHEAIKKAKELGCKIIFLDDGFSQYNIKKFNILLRPKEEPQNIFCLPSGGYREPKMAYSFADLQLQEGKDFKRVVSYSLNGKNIDILPKKLLLITAISKPKRLLSFLPKSIIMQSFEDHHIFTKEEINKIKDKYPNYSMITTSKDIVKLKEFALNDLYLMNLELVINSDVNIKLIDEYINKYKI